MEEFTLSTGEKIEVGREISADEQTIAFTIVVTTNHVVLDEDDIMDNNRFAKTIVTPNN